MVLFLDLVSPLDHNLECLVVLHTVELHRKYEAIHPEFNGVVCHLNILLCITWKVRVIEWIFAVHWEEMSKSLCSSRKKTSRHSAHSLRGRTTCSHTRSWDLSLWVGRKHSVIHATLHNASLDCVGYWQCSSSRKLAGLLPSKPSARSPYRRRLLSECVLTCLALTPKSEHQQARAPAAIAIDLHRGLKKFPVGRACRSER